jgi:hypothetical protein
VMTGSSGRGRSARATALVESVRATGTPDLSEIGGGRHARM